MGGLKPTIIRGGLELLYFTGAHLLLRPIFGGVGAILTMHHVRPPRPERFQPNRLLEVTPRFLANVIRDIAPLRARPRQPRRDAPAAQRRRLFAAFRLSHLRRWLSRYSAMGLSDPQGSGRAVRGLCADELSGSPRRIVVARARSGDRAQRSGRARRSTAAIASSTAARSREKRALYDELYWWLRARPTETELRSIVRSLAAFYHVDVAAFLQTTSA